MIQLVSGGVCAAKGYIAGGIHCGIRKNHDKKDLAMIVSEVPASAAAVYTTNLVKGAPLIVTKKNLQNGVARAVVCNSGNANTCNADGIEIAEGMCRCVSQYLHGIDCPPEDVIVASTGVIGQPLSLPVIAWGISRLSEDMLSPEGGRAAAEAIMTTDTQVKEVAMEFPLGGKTCRLGGIAKGSGMIHPNMATMLCFLTSDVAIAPDMLQKALSLIVKETFNMISIDGDTSTNDMVSILANGLAENPVITEENEDFENFCKALRNVCTRISRMIAKDGEGATKLLECHVDGAKDDETARVIAKSVISSSLVKAAMFGADANWGRVLCAIGYSGADVDVSKVDVSFEDDQNVVRVCENGAGIDFSEEEAKEVLQHDEIIIDVRLGDGNGEATAWGCDLTYDYVKINGDYRT